MEVFSKSRAETKGVLTRLERAWVNKQICGDEEQHMNHRPSGFGFYDSLSLSVKIQNCNIN